MDAHRRGGRPLPVGHSKEATWFGVHSRTFLSRGSTVSASHGPWLNCRAPTTRFSHGRDVPRSTLMRASVRFWSGAAGLRPTEITRDVAVGRTG